MKSKATTKLTIYLLTIIFLVCLVFTAACTKKKSEEKATTAPPVQVRLGKVTQGDITLNLELVGNVLPDKKAILTSLVPGKIKKVYHREGEQVPEAESLIEIDSEEVDIGMQQAQAALASAYAAAAQARIQRSFMKKEYDRIAKLKELAAVSESDFEKAKAAYKSTNETVRMAEAGIKQAKAAIAHAELYQRDTVLRAPFAGEIAKLLVEEGERIMTMPPTPIMALINYEKIKIECPVSERDVGSITEGMQAQVIFDAYPNVTVEASVGRVMPFLDAQSRTFIVQIFIDNPDKLYKPGMMARVYLKATYPNVITVNRDAFSLSNVTGDIRVVEVAVGNAANSVATAEANIMVKGLAKERKAIQGRMFGDRVELKDLGGLKVGSIVVISGASDILEGMKVAGALIEEKIEQVITEPTPTSTSEVAPTGGSTLEAIPSTAETKPSTIEVKPAPMSTGTGEGGHK